MTLDQLVKQAMDEHGLSRPELARLVGLSRSAIDLIVDGKTKSTEKVEEFAKALELDPEKIREAMKESKKAGRQSRSVPLGKTPEGNYVGLTDSGRGGVRRLTPVIGRASAGPSGHIAIGEPIGYEPTPPELANSPEGYLLYVAGDSMVPRFFPGERISVLPGRAAAKGMFVVVQFMDDANDLVGMVKRF